MHAPGILLLRGARDAEAGRAKVASRSHGGEWGEATISEEWGEATVADPGVRSQAFAEGGGEAGKPGPGLMEPHHQVQLIHTDLAVVEPAMGIVGPGAHEAPVLTHPPVNLADSSAESGSLGPLGRRRSLGRRPCSLHTDQLHGLHRASGRDAAGTGAPGVLQGHLGCLSQTAPRTRPQSLSWPASLPSAFISLSLRGVAFLPLPAPLRLRDPSDPRDICRPQGLRAN